MYGVIYMLMLLPATDPAKLTVPILPPDPLISTTSLAAHISDRAEELGVNARRALYIAEGESGLVATSTGDMHLTCPRGPKKGKLVRARGLWQITDCYHPEVTDEEAYDPLWSTDWALSRVKDRALCEKEWTLCRAWYRKETSRQ